MLSHLIPTMLLILFRSHLCMNMCDSRKKRGRCHNVRASAGENFTKHYGSARSAGVATTCAPMLARTLQNTRTVHANSAKAPAMDYKAFRTCTRTLQRRPLWNSEQESGKNPTSNAKRKIAGPTECTDLKYRAMVSLPLCVTYHRCCHAVV